MVKGTPSGPASCEWLEAVLQASQPVHLIASASDAGAWKAGKPVGVPLVSGTSRWQMPRSACRTMRLTSVSIGRKSYCAPPPYSSAR